MCVVVYLVHGMSISFLTKHRSLGKNIFTARVQSLAYCQGHVYTEVSSTIAGSREVSRNSILAFSTQFKLHFLKLYYTFHLETIGEL